MIIRRIWAPCLIGLLFILPFIASQTDEPTQNSNKTHNCDPGMFSCAKDSSCIPMDWIGDGEMDCSDGSDEHNEKGVTPPNLPKGSKNKTKVI